MTTFLLIVAAIGLIIFDIVATCILITRLLGIFYGGASFVPSSDESITKAIALAEIQTTDRAADIGSGNGIVVIAMAKAGAREAIGFEIDPLLVKTSTKAIREHNLSDRARIEKTNFWKSDLSNFDIIFIFQLPYAMPKLEGKLQRELKPGARVISNTFTSPTWQPEKTEGTIRLYRR